ncbi:MAG: efflux RND transporter periplasmic adaptor subunit [Ignavibacteria bacterium]|jgi:HlyD family secretion protein|nr:efflux RND transporter periplasmic adaptor subunit [Ignavibacteria bacterium]MCU7504367.1 efflux RND transporter periplasmic adaptor subunit [Ignavibacteria bacterium]MCU7517590.1 efflux RND transporter periplasmic adaptor subunit [Ignavibacteria bacterium]
MANNNKISRRIIVVSAVSLLIIAAVSYYLFASGKNDKNSYKFVKIEKGSIESLVSSTGVLNPVVTVQVGSQVSGTIARIFTDFNHKVKKGELIALIDTTFLSASVRDAQSSLDKAQAQFTQAGKDLERIKVMVQKNLAAQTDLETAEYNYAVAKAGVKSAQASLDRAKINLRYAKITAPISGTVIARNVDVGQTVAASLQAPTLFLIANDLSQMQIIANVDESDIGQIKVGQNVTFTVQAYPDKTFEGLVQQIRLQPTTIQNVVNYSVVINVSNNEGYLMPGMTATINFQIAHADNVLKVPNAALRMRPTPEMIAQAKSSPGRNAESNRRDSSAQAGSQNLATQNTGPQNKSGQALFQGQRKNSALLWFIDERGKLQALRVRTGLSDGQFTEVSSDKIHEGMDVVSGIVSSTTQTSQQGTPFQQNRSMTGAGRRGGF